MLLSYAREPSIDPFLSVSLCLLVVVVIVRSNQRNDYQAELMLGAPMFPGASGMDQLVRIVIS
jgi:hypothetical protein